MLYIFWEASYSPSINYLLNQVFIVTLEKENTLIYHSNTGKITAELLDDNGEQVICGSKDLPFLGIWSPVKSQQTAPFETFAKKHKIEKFQFLIFKTY